MTSTTTDAAKAFLVVSDPSHMEWMRDCAGIPANVPLAALARFLGLALMGHVVDPSEERAAAWFERECQLAVDAHEMTTGLTHEVEGILYGPSFGNVPDGEQYARAAQLIACRRNTCGGPGAGHEHVA